MADETPPETGDVLWQESQGRWQKYEVTDGGDWPVILEHVPRNAARMRGELVFSSSDLLEQNSFRQGEDVPRRHKY